MVNQDPLLLAIDFDGVICQSTDECMVTAYNAWCNYNGSDTFFSIVEDIPTKEAEFFRAYRGYVRSGGEYYILMRMLSENRAISGQQHFDELARQWHAACTAFSSIFYKCRQSLMRQNIGNWVALHYVFPEVLHRIKSRIDNGLTYIITMKDRNSVDTILTDKGLIVPEEKVFDKDSFPTKVAALEHLANKHGVPHANVRFLDDNVTHLLDPLAQGFDVYLADWGFHTNDQLKLVQNTTIKILKLNSLNLFFQDNE